MTNRTDLTELPYIHGFWGYRLNALNLDDRRSLLSAREHGIQNLDSITRNITHPGISDEYLHQFSYEFNEEAVDSISEFFRYSFYYGIIADIPEIRFDTSENESHSLSPN